MTPMEIFQTALAQSPAYRAFLTARLGAIPRVETREDFARLPFTNKADYILKYPLPDLCLGGDPTCAHLWLRSSGTSKKPFFWPRRAEDEAQMPQSLQRLFSAYVCPDAQPTLIVVGLALGPWGTGMQTSYAFRLLARETPGLAVVSPGLQNESILEVLERLSPHYRQTLLLSYPPFAKMVLEEAARRGLDLPALNIDVMVGGEGITEAYRERMWQLLGRTERNLDSVWSLYGSTDFANVGFENALSIAVRRRLVQHNLCEKILGSPEVPMLFQQVHSSTYFEEVDGELVVSRVQGIPLVRYRTGDHVKFIPRDVLLQQLREAGFDAEEHVVRAGFSLSAWDTPFIALYGRIDQAVFFYGAKITVEQIKAALDTPAMAPYFNGRFLVRGAQTETHDPIIEVALEDSASLRAANLDEITEQFARELDKVQSEFREIRKLTPDKPHVRLVPSEAKVFELGWKTRHM